MPKRPSKSDDPTVFAKNVLDEINAKHDAESATEEAKKAGKILLRLRSVAQVD